VRVTTRQAPGWQPAAIDGSQLLIGFGTALGLGWAVLGMLLYLVRSPGQSVADLARVFPSALRLAAALYRDRTLPRSVRRRMRIALIYNLVPINIIPDFVPVIGLVDNVAVLAWALRSTVRIAGPAVVAGHWKGSQAALTALYRALRLPGLPEHEPPP